MKSGLAFLVAPLAFLGVVAACPFALAISVDRLNDQEIALLTSTVKALDPLVAQRKKAGTAPLLTFEELYAPLTEGQRAFLGQIRGLDPSSTGGSNRKLPAPDPKTEFIRLDTQYLPRQAAEAYQRMMTALETDLGKRLLVESGYRSPAYQLYLFIFYMPKHDYSIRETNRFVALPGFSEHGSPQRQAIDFITPQGISGEDRPEEFEELQEYGWLLARAHEFGFYLSYPRGGPSAFEPWHWHYEAVE
ncbi:MAG: D-alanyl-D-alanine carboxypeptidase family protein [Candidatus Omnitrophica bacterium]|nr:D-alanyl-D-alanine carboxypeptidase family protein [Candidatus Omnitrophota bacterium]